MDNELRILRGLARAVAEAFGFYKARQASENAIAQTLQLTAESDAELESQPVSFPM